MSNVSKPLIALLVATVLMAALWMVALKPSSSSHGRSSGAGTYQSAIDKAHQAVATSNAASGAHGGTVASTPVTTTPATTNPRTQTTAAATPTTTQSSASNAPAQPSTATTQQRLDVVERALASHKVLALLFYNPAASDDRAVKQELAAVPTHGRRVVKLAVPLSELARYEVVSNQVPVSSSPTLVLVDGQRQATTIVGFADRFEIAQRVADALAAR